MDTKEELRKVLDNYSGDSQYPDDLLGLRCCKLAMRALDNGCYGVGAVLFDKDRKVLVEARNELFQDGFHSAAHAEMLIVDSFESVYPSYQGRDKLTLMVSLEPCPMCLTRLLISGIGRVIYLIDDHDGGMVHRLDRMPPVWRNLAQLQTHAPANVSPNLSAIAMRLATCQLAEMRKRLIETIRD